MTDINIVHLSKTYPHAVQPALDNLSLTIPAGTLTALLGPSGCGKTTVLKIIAGLMAPTSGDIIFAGQSILSKTPDQRAAVMVFQNPLLFPHMTVAENIGFGLKMRHQEKAEIAVRVAEMLALIQLETFGARYPNQLSGGQAQRVALGRALILRPRALLLDEPLSNLDTSLRSEMRDLIRHLQGLLGITTIVVTHDQEEAVVLADQIALILNGRLQQCGPPDTFFNQPLSESVARFFGGKNFIAGFCRDRMFTSDIGTLETSNDKIAGNRTLTIRPENIRIGAALFNNLSAKVTGQSYLGAQTRLILQVGNTQLEAMMNPQDVASVSVGMTVAINLPPQSLWLLPKVSAGADDGK